MGDFADTPFRKKGNDHGFQTERRVHEKVPLELRKAVEKPRIVLVESSRWVLSRLSEKTPNADAGLVESAQED